jgi:hypothetical protein
MSSVCAIDVARPNKGSVVGDVYVSGICLLYALNMKRGSCSSHSGDETEKLNSTHLRIVVSYLSNRGKLWVIEGVDEIIACLGQKSHRSSESTMEAVVCPQL